MWRCSKCGKEIDEDDFDVCWNCQCERHSVRQPAKTAGPTPPNAITAKRHASQRPRARVRTPKPAISSETAKPTSFKAKILITVMIVAVLSALEGIASVGPGFDENRAGEGRALILLLLFVAVGYWGAHGRRFIFGLLLGTVAGLAFALGWSISQPMRSASGSHARTADDILSAFVVLGMMGIVMGSVGATVCRVLRQTKPAVPSTPERVISHAQELARPKPATLIAPPISAEAAIDQQADLFRQLGFKVSGLEEAKAAARRTDEVRSGLAADLTFKSAVNRLLDIYKRHPQGFIQGSGGASEQEIRNIGQRLDDLGGKGLMLAVHADFAAHCPCPGAARNLEFMWDGIGTWLG